MYIYKDVIRFCIYYWILCTRIYMFVCVYIFRQIERKRDSFVIKLFDFYYCKLEISYKCLYLWNDVIFVFSFGFFYLGSC